MQFKKVVRQTIVVVFALVLGIIIGWRTTVINGIIKVDNANEHIGYFTVFGQTDEYYID